jgi:predicted ribosomally synthesized peptide with SipW-like signal peptide
MTERYELSRRKTLAGLATIGAAGAGAGLGTSALFTDEETFEDNQFTAGTLDMAVEGEIVATNSEYPFDVTGNSAKADGEVEVGFQLDDVKPGDWFILCLTVDSVAENPFYVTLHAEPDSLEEREGDSSEPESIADDDTADNGWEGPTETNAELGDKLLVSYWEQWGGSDRSDLANLDNITNTETNVRYTNTRASLDNGGDPGEDGVVQGQSSPPVGYTDVREFFYGLDQDPANSVTSGNDPLGNGFGSGDGILVGGTSDPVQVGSTDQSEIDRPRMSDPDEDGEAELRFYLLFELPEEVGNEIQGDRLRGDFRINAEQVRNNDDPRSGDQS